MKKFSVAVPGPDWHEQVQEKVLEPDIPIVDPHHHLWRRLELDYLLEDLQNDTQSGHDIRKTVSLNAVPHIGTLALNISNPLVKQSS